MAENEALPPGIDRRGFLRTTAGGTAAIALASVLPAGCGGEYAGSTVAAGSLRALSPKEYVVATAAAEALLADVPVEPAGVAASMDRELALVGGAILEDMKTVLTLLEHLTPLSGRLTTFTELEPEARRAYLHTWRDSRFNLRRAAFNAVKSFVYYFSYSQDATRSITGFEGPWPERVDIPAYAVDYGEIR